MPDDDTTNLRQQVEELRTRLDEAEATLDAIRNGEVDALVVAGAGGHRVYTLEGADQFYRVLIEAMQPGQGAASLSTDGTVLYCNRSFAALLNLPQERVGGSAFRQYVLPAYLDRWDAILGDAATGQGQGEVRLVRRGGTPVPVHLALNPLPLTGAVALGLVVTDLTDRKRQEEAVRLLATEGAARVAAERDAEEARQAGAAVRASEARFRQLANALPQIVWIARPDGYVDYFNERWYEFTGFTRDECGDAAWLRVLHPDDARRTLDTYYESVRTGRIYEIEYRFRDRRTGDYRWFLGRAYPVRDEAGEVLRWFGTCTDIDDMKKAGERQMLLWEAASALLLADDPDTMLKGLFTKLAPHLGLDAYFNFMLNEAGDALELYSCVGIPEGVARDISRLEFGQAICGSVAQSRRPICATAVQQSDDPRVQLVKSFGIRCYACNPLMAGPRLLGTLSFASRSRDRFEDDELDFLRTVSHYTTVAYERLRLVRQLRETDRKKDEFLATLAHELRNPLAPIRNAAQVLKLRGTNDPDLAAARNIIERQANHLKRLVDDLLDVSRITHGKITLQRERLALGTVLTNAVEANRPLIEAAGHQLTVSLPAEPLVLEGDPTRLVQVFGNLLTNAVKYTDRRGQIWVTARRDGAGAEVSVRDTGIGIPADHLPKVFEMFSQVDSALERTHGGLGIGLSLVKGLVQMHGGTVTARSDGAGSGSEFVVRLPLLVEPPSAPHPERTEPAAGPPTGPKRRILVADDNPDSVESLATLLSIVGHEVNAAHDGQAAVELAEALRPDVILLDIGMPRLNGYEAARRIREREWGRGVVLVALTGWGQEEDKRRAEAAGFDHHFTKPVAPEALWKLLAYERSTDGHDGRDGHHDGNGKPPS
jgi:PAS domain S-box-containing protein